MQIITLSNKITVCFSLSWNCNSKQNYFTLPSTGSRIKTKNINTLSHTWTSQEWRWSFWEVCNCESSLMFQLFQGANRWFYSTTYFTTTEFPLQRLFSLCFWWSSKGNLSLFVLFRFSFIWNPMKQSRIFISS